MCEWSNKRNIKLVSENSSLAVFLLTILACLNVIQVQAATTYSGSNGIRLKLLTSNSVSACSGCHDDVTAPDFTSSYTAFSTYATTYHAGIKTDAVQRMTDRTNLVTTDPSFMPQGAGSQINATEKALLVAWKANGAVDVDRPTTTTLTTITGKGKNNQATKDSAYFTVYANVDDSGIDATDYSFQYGLTQSPTFESASQVVTGSGGGLGTVGISQVLSALDCGETYYYRIKASNATYASTVGSWQEEDTPTCNTPPSIQSTPLSPINAIEDIAYSFTISALDGETDDISFSLSNQPTGMAIDSASGEVTWTATEGITSSGLVTVIAQDAGYDGVIAASETFTINVTAVNDAPQITSTAVTSAIENTLYSYQLVVNDPDDSGAALSYSVAPKTGDMDISTSGLLTWTPANNVTSSGSITVTVADGGENSAIAATQVFTINVTAVNTAPNINTTAGTLATEDVAYQYTVGVVDLDDDNNGTDLQFTLSNEPSGMTVSATGVIDWIPLEGQGDANNIQLIVSDGGENSVSPAQEVFSIAVTSVNDAPQISSSASTSAIESSEYNYQVVVNDPDDSGLELNYQLTAFPTGMVISASGLVTWTPGNGVITSGTVTIEVSDGGEDSAAIARQSFTINVNGVNTAPSISSTAGTAATEDVEFLYAVQVVDADDVNNGTDISFVLSNAPTGMTVSTTGVITWTPIEGQGNADNIQLSVADGGENGVAAALEVFSIVVSTVNDAPTITSSANLFATEGQAYSYQVIANDSDDLLNELTFQLITMPTGMSITNTGLISWVPDNGLADSGTVTVRVTDGGENGAMPAEQSFTISITAVNTAPMILSTASSIGIEDQLYQYRLVVVDEDDDNNGSDLLFSLTNAPEGMVVSNTGIITWLPLQGQPDVLAIQVRVSDGGEDGAEADYETFSISVTAVNDAPQLSSIADQTITELETLTIDVGALVTDVDDDNDGTGLTWSLINSPLSMAIDNLGNITWQSPEESAASYTITVQVADGGEDSAAVAQQSFQLVVNLLDSDADTVADYNDNCASLANLDQLNTDSDSLGNECDDDDDNDTIPDAVEIANNLDPLDASDAALDSDGDGDSNSVEQAQCVLSNNGNDLCAQILRDSVAPVITTNGDQQLISSGYLTAVELVATAFDIKDGELIASADNLGPFRPGKHTVVWQAQDQIGNQAEVSQQVLILPLIKFSGLQQIAANNSNGQNVEVRIPISLSGEAPEYPVLIDYEISGTADESEHDLSSGQIQIDSGLATEIVFNWLDNQSIENDKNIVIQLLNSSESAHLTDNLSYQVDFLIGNLAPVASMSVSQGGEQRAVIYQDQGPFVISIEVDDKNNDELEFTLTRSNELLTFANDIVPNELNQFQFDSNDFPTGFYSLQLITSDGELSDVRQLSFRIESQVPILSNNDSDGDGIADDQEGLTDSDDDGIQDYLDPIDDPQYMHKNLLANDLIEVSNELLETESGLVLKAGQWAIEQGQAGVGLAADDLNPVNNAELDKNIIGDVFDFEIHGINANETSVKIVIPLATGIPLNAEYWKYNGSDWVEFDLRGEDYLATAFKQDGRCPNTDSDLYKIGLLQFRECLLLSITDGGINDTDGAVNGVVTDPGAIVMDSLFVVSKTDHLTEPKSSPGAGNASIIFMFILLCLASLRAQAEFNIQALLELGGGSDDNVSRAQHERDIIFDNFFRIDSHLILDYELSFNKSISLELQAAHQAYQYTDLLSRNEYSARMIYRWQNSFYYNSPWYQVFSDIRILDIGEQQRDSTLYTQQAMVSARLTTKISASLGAEYQVRDSESRVFDRKQSRLFMHLDYAWSDSLSLYSGYSYIQGDTVSTVQSQYCNGLIATSVYPLLTVSKAIEWDQVFNDAYCGSWISYRLDASTQTVMLGANYGFDHSSSLDLSWLYADVQAEGNNYYQRQIIQLNYLKAF